MHDILLRESIYKKILRKHGIPNYDIAEILGYSYAYTSHLLSGNVKMPASAAEKLEAFCKKLEDGNI
jgi:DNA-binding Xre family transcriptional regulator